MAEGSLFRDDYETSFDPSEYLSLYFATPEGHKDAQDCAKNNNEFWASVFGKVHKEGSRILDLGSGPCIDRAIPASRYYSTIYLSDYAARNRTAVEDWMERKPGVHDWAPYMEYYAKKEGISTITIEERTRAAIKGVVHCDVTSADPLAPAQLEPFDCITSSLCLETACKTEQQYSESIGSINKLLNPGGHLVLTGVLNDSFYYVGKSKFHCLPLTVPFMEGVLKDRGFGDIEAKQYSFTEAESVEDMADCAGYFFITAAKYS